MNNPLVSIIIPCYNNEAFVKQAIESALQQTYTNVEIIVIDDGSTDGSLEIIRSFENHIQWETGSNQGAPKARNRGLELAQGEYIRFLDADDILFRNCLEHQVERASQISSERKAIGMEKHYQVTLYFPDKLTKIQLLIYYLSVRSHLVRYTSEIIC